MAILEVKGLTKNYPNFYLSPLFFSLESGKIYGFVGRNGAGKSTTIKSMLNIVHKDSGEITYFGLPFPENEKEIKKRIGYSIGNISWYPKKPIKELAKISKLFYENWDDNVYRQYLSFFELDENKCPSELSEGMKVKCNLLMALSHHPEILILDEPTSGLDPFSRDEILDIFLELKKKGVAILFSTHIISDIEKSANHILYFSHGEIKANKSKEDFLYDFRDKGDTIEKIILQIEKETRHA